MEREIKETLSGFNIKIPSYVNDITIVILSREVIDISSINNRAVGVIETVAERHNLLLEKLKKENNSIQKEKKKQERSREGKVVRNHM